MKPVPAPATPTPAPPLDWRAYWPVAAVAVLGVGAAFGVYFRLRLVERSEAAWAALLLLLLLTALGAGLTSAFLHRQHEQRQLLRALMLEGRHRARIEDELRQSEARFRALVENGEDTLFILGSDARPTYISPNAARGTGYSLEELYQFPPFASIHPDDEPLARQVFARALEAPRVLHHYLLRLRRKEGPYRWIEGTLVNLLDEPSVGGLVANFREVTERQRAVEQERATWTMLEDVMNNIPQGVFWKDRESRYLGCNEVVSQAFGLSSPRAIVGLRDADLPSLTAEQAAFFVQKDREVMERGKAQHQIIEPATLADGSIIWLETNKIPLRNEKGDIIGVLGTWQDITPRRQAEQQLLASLREKETLLKEVHHRVKNNLQIISSLLSLQQERLAEPSVRAAFEQSQGRIRALALVHETLYRTDTFTAIDMPRYVRGLGDQLLRGLGAGGRGLVLDLEVAAVSLDLDRALPCGLIINELLSNALKYAFPGGRPGQVRVALQPADQGHWSLTVSDDGVGLAEGVTPGVGASLGLSLVHLLTQQLGGDLQLRRGGGTTFIITFPLATPKPCAAEC